MKHFKRIVALLCMISLMATSYAFGVYAEEPQEEGITGTVTHICFGSYPQTEIVGEASQSGVHGKSWAVKSDYIVDESLYAELQDEEGWVNNDKVINNEKYHRIKKADVKDLYTGKLYLAHFYKWSNSTTYHYFKYEPIRWRILEESEDDAFLLSELALDNQMFEETYRENITWKNCTIRKWLNGDFLNMAFSADEKDAIKTTQVNTKPYSFLDKSDGINTDDKVFLLSKAEVSGVNGSKYGFASNSLKLDKVRYVKASAYAKAMGAYMDTTNELLGNCIWWLRSPGERRNQALFVELDGNVDYSGSVATRKGYAIRPALHLNLKATETYVVDKKDAMIKPEDVRISPKTFKFDLFEKKPVVRITGLREDIDFRVIYPGAEKPGQYTLTVCGIGDCSGTIIKAFSIDPIKSIKKANAHLSFKSKEFTGKKIKPKVIIPGYKGWPHFTVACPKNPVKIGTYKVVVKGDKGLTGSITLKYKIVKPHVNYPKNFQIKKIAKNKVKVSWDKAIGVTGYQISQAVKKNDTKVVAKIKGKTKKLKATRKYYYKVRAYKKVAGKTFYSKWTKIKRQ